MVAAGVPVTAVPPAPKHALDARYVTLGAAQRGQQRLSACARRSTSPSSATVAWSGECSTVSAASCSVTPSAERSGPVKGDRIDTIRAAARYSGLIITSRSVRMVASSSALKACANSSSLRLGPVTVNATCVVMRCGCSMISQRKPSLSAH